VSPPEAVIHIGLDTLTSIVPSHPGGESLLFPDVLRTGNGIPDIVAQQQATGQATQIVGWTTIRRLAPVTIVDLEETPVHGSINVRGIDGFCVERALALHEAQPIG